MALTKNSKNKIVKKISLKKKIKVIKVTSKKTRIISKIKKIIKPKTILKKSKLISKSKLITKKKVKIIEKKKEIVKKGEINLKLKKVLHNPIIEPSLYSWESKATFNPTAFEHDGKIHIIYRAIGEDDSSVLGYAYSLDGLNIEGRPTYHIYKRFFNYNENLPKIDYISGGGWSGGCEDPRVVLIDDTIYLIFTAFDGWGSVRLALTSISLNDFKKKKWNWKKAVMISPPGEINKNWVLFPEKINGKFAIMHSFYPDILIDYFDSLDELDGKKFIKSNNTRPVDYTRGWDSWFRGIGPAPIKTKDGWLVLYHAMDHKNPDRYRMGAMLLDLKDPTKILHRSKSPILEPEEDYENNGHKWGVVYSCGAVVKNDELFVYYGGADKFVCVASIDLKELLDDLKKDKGIKLIKSNKRKI
ncbi:MAG TPA: hypothetical protein VIK86_10080 [Candidatus Paceibacterota bacterium]